MDIRKCKNIGEFLKGARLEMGMSQREFAKKIDISHTTLLRIESRVNKKIVKFDLDVIKDFLKLNDEDFDYVVMLNEFSGADDKYLERFLDTEKKTEALNRKLKLILNILGQLREHRDDDDLFDYLDSIILKITA